MHDGDEYRVKGVGTRPMPSTGDRNRNPQNELTAKRGNALQRVSKTCRKSKNISERQKNSFISATY